MPDLTSTTVTTSVLKVPFTLEDGNKLTVNLPDPQPNLSKDDITGSTGDKNFAFYIVSENLISKDGIAATGVGEPYYYNTEKIVFD